MFQNIKQIFFAATVAAMMFGLASCDSTTISTKNANPSNDSVAMARGYAYGAQMSQQLMMSAMQGDPIDTIAFLKGISEGVASATDSARFGYYAGLMTGYQMGRGNNSDSVNNSLFIDYFKAALTGDTTKIKWAADEAMAFLKKAEEKMQAEKMEKEYGPNKEKGLKYLEQYKAKEGVKTLPSGVAYKVLKEGTGKVKPVDTDRVKVNYIGRLIDGTEFDKSEGEPVVFGVTQVIPGWTAMLKEMTVGQKVEVVIPYDQAYGERSMDKIKPLSTLVFEVELVGIEPASK